MTAEEKSAADRAGEAAYWEGLDDYWLDQAYGDQYTSDVDESAYGWEEDEEEDGGCEEWEEDLAGIR